MANTKSEKTCGDCFWLTRIDEPASPRVTHYCRLHYTQEARSKNESACNDYRYEGGKSANQ